MSEADDDRDLNSSPRGPSAPLTVVYGSKPGGRLSIRHDGQLVETASVGAIKTGRIERWGEAVVLAGTKENVRAWRIEPGPAPNTLGFEDFSVSGRFVVVETINNARGRGKPSRRGRRRIWRSEVTGGATRAP